MKHIIRRYFIAGILVWLPILVTFIIIRFLVRLMDGTLSLLPHKYQPEQLFGMDIPGLGLIFTLIVLLITGFLATNFLGRKLVELWEKLLARIPLIRSIYAATKQVISALVHPSGKAFRKVLLIQYPRKGIWSIAFQTSEKFSDLPTDESVITAFVPTTPNPTSGFLTLIPKKDTQELDMSVEEALRMVISLGVVMPDKMHKEKNEETTSTTPET